MFTLETPCAESTGKLEKPETVSAANNPRWPLHAKLYGHYFEFYNYKAKSVQNSKY